MDCLEQARALYGEYHHQHHRPGGSSGGGLSQEKQASISTAVTRLIRTCLLQQGGSASFRYHQPFCRAIRRTVGASRFHGDRSAAAFLTLERYLLLLAQQPWKREFWVMKLYGGYFCTKVRAHLEGAEEILQLIGFVPEQAAEGSANANAAASSPAVCLCLVLEEAPDPQVALNVAFDCQVAALECRYIGEYHGKMRCVGLDLADAMNVLLSGPSSSSDLLVGSLSMAGPGGGGGGGELGFRSSSGSGSGGGGVSSVMGGGAMLANMKVSYNPGSMLPPDTFSAGQGQAAGASSSLPSSLSSPSVKSHTVLASGGMGIGVVTGAGVGARSMHQVIGVQPSSSASASHHASVLAGGGGGGGGLTHQVIGVSATHHHHHHNRPAAAVGGGGGGLFQASGGGMVMVSSGATPTESYNAASMPSAAAATTATTIAAAVVRGSGTGTTAAGAGHSVLHVTGVPASSTTHHHPTPVPTSHQAAPPSADPLSRKLYTPAAPVLQPALASHHHHHHLPSSTPAPLPYSEPAYTSCPVVDPRLAAGGVEGMMTTILPPAAQHQQQSMTTTGLVVVGGGGGGESGRASFMTSSSSSHPSSVVYQPPGSRGSYASSGYGSGSASVLSGGSSAYTASSSYCSAASSSSPSHHEYANLPLKPPASAGGSGGGGGGGGGECVDPHLTQLSRPSRAQQSQKPQFSFIQEDEIGYGAPFPEATHEEHLRESLRNLQVSHLDKTQKRPLSKNLSSQLAAGHRVHQSDPRMGGSGGGGAPEGQVPVTYDDWRWFRGDSRKGLASSSTSLSPCKMMGGGGEGGGVVHAPKSHPASGNVQPSAGVLRPTISSHPGTATTTPSSSSRLLPLTDPKATANMAAMPLHPAGMQLPHPQPLPQQQGEMAMVAAPSPSSWKATMTPNPVYYYHPPAPPSGLAQQQHLDDMYCNTSSLAAAAAAAASSSSSNMMKKVSPLSHQSHPLYPTSTPTPTPTPLTAATTTATAATTTATAVASQRRSVTTMPPAARWEERPAAVTAVTQTRALSSSSSPLASTSLSLLRTSSPPSPPSPSSPPLASPIYNNLDRTMPAITKVLNISSDVERSLLAEAVKKPGDVGVLASPRRGGGGGGSSSMAVPSASSSSLYANLVDLSGPRAGGVDHQHHHHHLRHHPHQGPYSTDGDGVWACESCTVENGPGSTVCQMCGRSRGSSRSPAAAGGDGGGGVAVAPLFSVAGESRRVCPACTFENPPGCRSCEVCEVLLPQDVHTYV